MTVEVLLSLGSNLGEREANLARALRRLEELAGVEVLRVSRVYETEAWGSATGQPAYANAVALVRTDLAADVLLDWIGEVESELGRERGERNAARTIDIDILLFGDEEWHGDRLSIPHPRMLEREFVVVPLLQVAPDARLPDGTPVRSLSGRARAGRIVGELGQLPGYGLSASPPEGAVGRDLPLSLDEAEEAVRRAPDVSEQPDVWWDPDEEWVALDQVPRTAAGGTAILRGYVQLLHDEGVPAMLDPPEAFGHTGAVPYIMEQPVRLLVPRSFESRARQLLSR